MLKLDFVSSVFMFYKTSCLLLLCFTRLHVFCFMLYETPYLLFLCFTRLHVFCFNALRDFMSFVFMLYKNSMSVSSAFMPYRTSMSSILCFFYIGLQGLMFCVVRLQCPFVLSISLFCFLCHAAFNHKITRMKLVSLS